VTSRPVVSLGPVRGVFCGLDYDAISAAAPLLAGFLANTGLEYGPFR
jgi:hypothetical protein